ncbi:50S ribosomal protein L11 methyltransferase [Desulfosarcina variabilis]|uniref:50S ribosomal protein L11 methyltransferase n=1 Tax=Desulfosarcina variabilis TaxID=2300 RepID=UPI003AFAEF5D
MSDLESKIMRIIDESPSKVTFRLIKNRLDNPTIYGVRAIKKAVANLVSLGTLCYTFHFGQSFIERSLDKPVQLSPHVILKPFRCKLDRFDTGVVISIEKGVSFGCGDHPTTRMAVQLIDRCLHQPLWVRSKKALKAIDIGTGSGILSIAAAKLGIGFVNGVDTDPCSVFEAKENVRINQLNDRIQISSQSLDDIHQRFDFVLANLRTPTLIKLCDLLNTKLNQNSVLVLSGMKAEETPSVSEPYKKMGFRVVEVREEKGWSAICLLRG